MGRNSRPGMGKPQISPLRFASVEMTKERVVMARNSGPGMGNRGSLHYAPPDFLWRAVALITCMRLSLRRAAHVDVASSAK
jgi:hypothetical protein